MQLPKFEVRMLGFLGSFHSAILTNEILLLPSSLRVAHRIRPMQYVWHVVYLESDRGHRSLSPPREDFEMVLYEGAVAELDRRPGGHVVEAVLGYPVSPFHLGPRLRPVYNGDRKAQTKTRNDKKSGRIPGVPKRNEFTLRLHQGSRTLLL